MNDVVLNQGLSLENLIIGVIAPLLTALLSKQSWPGWVKGGICLLIALLFATVQNVANFKIEDWAGSLFVIFVSAQAIYQALWKQLGLTEALQQVGPVKD